MDHRCCVVLWLKDTFPFFYFHKSANDHGDPFPDIKVLLHVFTAPTPKHDVTSKIEAFQVQASDKSVLIWSLA
jgi:hypothetical protein